MRLLYLTDRLSVHDRRFIDAVVARGHEVFPHAVGETRETDNATSVLAHSVSRPTTLSALRAKARDLRIDVVHAGPLPTTGFAAARAGLRPLVTCSWAFDVLRDARQSRRTQDHVQAALAASDAVIVDARVVEEAIRSDYGYQGRVARFPWGTDLDVFRPSRAVKRTLGHRQTTHVVISTRSWEPLYRTDLILEAFAIASVRDHSLRLILANDGSQSPQIRERIEALGIAGLVTLPGHVSEAQLAALMRESDSYISAAPVDGASVSLLQAMASGLLTVCADTPGNREWLRNEPGSVLLDAPDPELWADAIVETTSLDPRLAGRVRARNRSIALRRADWRVNSRILVSTYEDCAGV